MEDWATLGVAGAAQNGVGDQLEEKVGYKQTVALGCRLFNALQNTSFICM